MSDTFVVLKFGGKTLATPNRVRLAARRVRLHRRRGDQPVVVASAMGQTTDRILRRIERVAPGSGRLASPREADRALASGEQEAAALVALALASLGLRAVSLQGGEAGLWAEGPYGAGQVVAVDTRGLRALMSRDIVPVVCGYQAARADGELVTLGRNSSDLTAVSLADALGAECHLVKDVDGVYSPGPDPGATDTILPWLDHDALVSIAMSGARVVHSAAAELARDRRVPLHIYHFRRPWGDHRGTRVGPTADAPARREVSG